MQERQHVGSNCFCLQSHAPVIRGTTQVGWPYGIQSTVLCNDTGTILVRQSKTEESCDVGRRFGLPSAYLTNRCVQSSSTMRTLFRPSTYALRPLMWPTETGIVFAAFRFTYAGDEHLFFLLASCFGGRWWLPSTLPASLLLAKKLLRLMNMVLTIMMTFAPLQPTALMLRFGWLHTICLRPTALASAVAGPPQQLGTLGT